MENITIKINGVEVSAPAGSTILEAARLAHIDIPTLCYLKEINEIGKRLWITCAWSASTYERHIIAALRCKQRNASEIEHI